MEDFSLPAGFRIQVYFLILDHHTHNQEVLHLDVSKREQESRIPLEADCGQTAERRPDAAHLEPIFSYRYNYNCSYTETLPELHRKSQYPCLLQ